MKQVIRILALLIALCFLCACSEQIAQTVSANLGGLSSAQPPESSAASAQSSETPQSSEPDVPSSEASQIAQSSQQESSAASQESSVESSEVSSEPESSEVSSEVSSEIRSEPESSQESSASSSESSVQPEEFGPIEYEDLMAAIRDLPGLYGNEHGNYGQEGADEDDQEGEYIEIFYDFGRFYASVMYTIHQSVYSFAALELKPFDCCGNKMRFTAQEYSVMSQWNQYVSTTSVILEPTEDGLIFTAEDEGGFFPQGTIEFEASDLLGPRAFMYTSEDLRTYYYEDLGEATCSDALIGSWVAYTDDGRIINLKLGDGDPEHLSLLIDDQDDFVPDRYMQGGYIAVEGPGSISFYYLGAVLSAGGMPSSGELTVALIDQDTFSVIAVPDDLISNGEDLTFHRTPWAP